MTTLPISEPMFGVILPSRPVLLNSTTINPGKFAFAFPSTPSFSHIVVFLLPGNELPIGAAAAVYIQLPGSSEFKLLGAIGREKQSAIFKINNKGHHNTVVGNGGPDEDIMLDEAPDMNGSLASGQITLGISVEPVASVQTQLEALKASQVLETSTALVRRPPTTKVLAQRIIKNAFNFLASFAGGPGGNEVVPLKSFQDWWTKFERKIEVDPGFLERDEDA
ncbi:Protein of unknown function DUF775 [Lasallia pustulata]|uniref:Uncharacterized protein n=1 Tax=Lasallia pustulata TaxID=136370 RepID=A0A1W5DB55_9LECA|nr:Protein of unknown function DUF775 [Lasallia pustulata]